MTEVNQRQVCNYQRHMRHKRKNQQQHNDKNAKALKKKRNCTKDHQMRCNRSSHAIARSLATTCGIWQLVTSANRMDHIILMSEPFYQWL
uniref:Innexin n=1 Tax=Parascaris univalens TaxID=6257 RepID=A0A915B178_PARUN